METLVGSLAGSATDTYNPAYGGSTSLGETSAVPPTTEWSSLTAIAPSAPEPGTEFFWCGKPDDERKFQWHGLILIIGQGSFTWSGGGNGQINGGMFLARTRANDRSSTNLLGTMLSTRGAVNADFNGGGTNAIQLNKADMTAVNSAFPFSAISYKEYSHVHFQYSFHRRSTRRTIDSSIWRGSG